MLFRRDDRQIGAITERIRAIVLRQPGHDLCSAALVLNVPALDLARLLDSGEAADRALLVDVVAALAHEAGVDPQWILTGAYDGAVHRHVLRLGEDRSAIGRTAVRNFVQEQYRQLRRDALFAWVPGWRSVRHTKTAPTERARSA